jgi:hypothetical protein
MTSGGEVGYHVPMGPEDLFTKFLVIKVSRDLYLPTL